MKRYLFVFIFTLLLLLYPLFGQLLHLGFFSDDFIWLTDARQDTVVDTLGYFYQANNFFYRPFTKLYYFAAWRVWGEDAFGYHAFNIVLHTIISVLVFLFCNELLRKLYHPLLSSGMQRGLLSFAAGVLFFVLPAHLENIAWSSAVTELFPPLFVLIALLIFSRKLLDGGMRHKLFWIAVFFGCFWLGLFSHEYVAVFPLLVYLTDLFLTSRFSVSLFSGEILLPFVRRTQFYVLLGITDIFYLILRFISHSHWSGGDYSYNLIKLPLNFIGNFFGYLGVSMVGSAFVTVYQQMRMFMRDNLYLSIFVFCLIVLGVGVMWYTTRRIRWSRYTNIGISLYVFLICFFIICLLPFLGLGGLAERYAYLPSVAYVIAVSVGGFLFVSLFGSVRVYWYIFYGFLLIPLLFHYSLQLVQDQLEWQNASGVVQNLTQEFKDNCGSFKKGETLSRVSPSNRIGRAWVFQVGYEQAANLYCDKNLKILRI